MLSYVEVQKTLTKFGIIVPVMNDHQGIRRTLDSIACQNYQAIEVLVVDGFSSDGTEKILKEYNMSKPLKVIRRKPLGLYNAINFGIATMDVDCICILNSSDFYVDENVIENYAQNYKEDVVLYSNLRYLNEQLNFDHDYASVKSTKDFMIKGCDIPHPTTVIPKYIYERYGIYDERFKIAADFDMLHRLYFGGVEFKYCDFSSINFAPAGLSSNIIPLIFENYKIREQNGISRLINLKLTISSLIKIHVGLLIQRMFGQNALVAMRKWRRT